MNFLIVLAFGCIIFRSIFGFLTIPHTETASTTQTGVSDLLHLLVEEKALRQQLEEFVVQLKTDVEQLKQNYSTSNGGNKTASLEHDIQFLKNANSDAAQALNTQQQTNLHQELTIKDLQQTVKSLQNNNTILEQRIKQQDTDMINLLGTLNSTAGVQASITNTSASLEHDIQSLKNTNSDVMQTLHTQEQTNLHQELTIKDLQQTVKSLQNNNTILEQRIKQQDTDVINLVNTLNSTTDEQTSLTNTSVSLEHDIMILKQRDSDVEKALHTQLENNLHQEQTIKDLQQTAKLVQNNNTILEGMIKNLQQQNTDINTTVYGNKMTISGMQTSITKHSEKVAFTAQLYGSSRTIHSGNVLVFAIVISNTGGEYNRTTGKFTCKTPGLYLFHVSILCRYSGYAYIVKSGSRKLSLLPGSSSSDNYNSGSVDFVYNLSLGDQIYVESNSNNYYHGYSYFSGVLINAS